MTSPAPLIVTASNTVRLKGGNNIRRAGFAEVDGQAGFVSGSRHLTAPQIFRPLAEMVAGSDLPAFDGDLPEVDQTDLWDVKIDGRPSAVRKILRKSLPIKTENAGLEGYAHTRRHLLTIELEQEIMSGQHVELNHSGLRTIVAERQQRAVSEIIHVCQQGYALDTPKKAYLGLWLGHTAAGEPGNTDDDLFEGKGWRLIDAGTDAVVLSGGLELAKAGDEPHRGEDNFNGCNIYVADFSEHAANGLYHLEVDEIGRSFPFSIAENPFQECLRAAARWYFHQRSGIAIEAPYGEGRQRPRNGHPDDGLKVWQSAVELGPTREGYGSGDAAAQVRKTRRLGLLENTPSGRLPGSENPEAWGGWHDAGDWDRRIQHMDVVFMMANIIEMFPTSRSLDLNIPESGKAFSETSVAAKKSQDDLGDGETILPDLIHEALWGISLWRRTQTQEGGIIGGVEYAVVGTVGAVSWNPLHPVFAFKPEPWAAYRFVIAAAKLGHVISATVGDRTLGNSLMAEATSAWAWAESHWDDFVLEMSKAAEAETETPDPSHIPSGVFGARIAAAAALFRATGSPDAREVFEAHNPFAPQSEEGSYGARKAVFSFESLEYLRAANEGRDHVPEIVEEMAKWAQWHFPGPRRMGSDYGLHSTQRFPRGRGWARFGPGSNWRASDFAIQYVVDQRNKGAMLDRISEGMWFALGCNPSNVSFVQGFGSRQFSDPSGGDYKRFPKVPGQICFGVAAGDLFAWELRRAQGQLYPADQADWPAYTQIYESSAINLCAEHGMKSNAMEWLFALAFMRELLAS